MLETAKKILTESGHPDVDAAMREVNVVLAAVKYYQVVLKRMDRDDKVIQKAIDEAVWMRNSKLVCRLKQLLGPVKVPYEELI